MDTFFVFLLLFTELILFGIAWYLFDGDIISPSVVTLGFFILSAVCFIYNIRNWDIVFSFKAYMLFCISFILMIVTEKVVSSRRIVVDSKKNRTRGQYDQIETIFYIPEPYNSLLFIAFFICFLIYIVRVYQSGIKLGASGFLSAIGYNKEEGGFDSLARLAYNIIRIPAYIYTVMFANNVFACKQSLKQNMKSMLIIFFTLFITFFSGQRSAIIAFLIGIVIAIKISLFDSQKLGHKVNMKKFIRKMFIIAAIVMVVFFLSANIVKATNIKRDPLYYLTYYFGSTTALMGKIVSTPSLCHEPFVGYFGEKTFQGFWNTMYSWGIVSMAPAERKWIRLGGKVTNSGNEYTFFCGPYIDFGFLGTLIFVIIFYALFSYMYYWKIKKVYVTKKRCFICAVYLFLFVMVMLSFYMDIIRSYSRPINILYIIYMAMFCKIFLRIKRKEVN